MHLCPVCSQTLPPFKGLKIDVPTGYVINEQGFVKLPHFLARLADTFTKRSYLSLDQINIILSGRDFYRGDGLAPVTGRVYIHLLRKRLKPLGVGFEFIWGKGYKMVRV